MAESKVSAWTRAIFCPALAIFCTLSLSCDRNVPNPSATPRPMRSELKLDATPDRPISFGIKATWLAVKTSDMQQVVKALHLEDARPANWKAYFSIVYQADIQDRHVFVAPPVRNWIFVVGRIPELASSVGPDKTEPLLRRLSKEFGETQYFGNHRVSDWYAWARAIDGEIVRAFVYADGEALLNAGAPTSDEQQLGFKFSQLESYTDDAWRPEEDNVMDIAGRWSINPMSLEDLNLPPSTGIAGQLPPELR